MTGKYGLEAQGHMFDKEIQLKYELANLKKERETLASRVLLLKDGNIERDMLDEQARYHLNLLHGDEIVIMRTSN